MKPEWVCLDRDDPRPEFKLETENGVAYVYRGHASWFYTAHLNDFSTVTSGHAAYQEKAIQLAELAIT